MSEKIGESADFSTATGLPDRRFPLRGDYKLQLPVRIRKNGWQAFTSARPEPVEGREALRVRPFMVRQAHHERSTCRQSFSQLSLDQMAELFQRNKSTISRHIKNVLKDGELDEKEVVAFFAITTKHGAIEEVYSKRLRHER